MKHWWNDTDNDKTELFGENLVPFVPCPTRIPNGLPWNQTWASKVRSLWLTS